VASENFYSRLVAWLKILLPLAALGILSSVVFFARDADDQRTIPFVTQEGGPDTPGERVTQPEYVGVTADGAQITMHAEQVSPVEGNTQLLDAWSLRSKIETVDGRVFDAAAPEARIDLEEGLAHFLGEVTVETSDGFTIVSENLDTRLDTTSAESDGPVSGTAPFGTLDAGRFSYTARAEGESLLVFNGGVKLIYQPRNRGGAK
jgi:lipopolysaccharide export system protein LptC